SCSGAGTGPAMNPGDAPGYSLRWRRAGRLAELTEVKWTSLDRLHFLVLLAISDVGIARAQLCGRAGRCGKASNAVRIDMLESSTCRATGLSTHLVARARAIEYANVAAGDLVARFGIGRCSSDESGRSTGNIQQMIVLDHESPPTSRRRTRLTHRQRVANCWEINGISTIRRSLPSFPESVRSGCRSRAGSAGRLPVPVWGTSAWGWRE